jgi:branched-chain amino acid aminotransferase
MATSEARTRGYDEALMTDIHGFIAQAPSANFFLEKNGILYTPPLGHIVQGITRQTVLNICHELDITVIEKDVRPEDLEGADSAFLCGTATEIAGIESVDAKPFKLDWFDTIGISIQEAYKCQVREKSFSYVII